MTQQSIDVVLTSTQRLLVSAAGEDIANIGDPSRETEVRTLPDFVQSIVKAANLGMMAGGGDPSKSQAKILRTQLDRERKNAQWEMEIAGVDPGMITVLANTLMARDLESWSIQSASGDGGGPRSRVAPPYPPTPQAVPFALAFQIPQKSRKDRLVQIQFQSPLTEEQRDRAMEGVQLWDEILVLAGYPRERLHPKKAFTYPDEPYWLDQDTLEQSFMEAFDSREDCFGAMINWAVAAHSSGLPVQGMSIR